MEHDKEKRKEISLEAALARIAELEGEVERFRCSSQDDVSEGRTIFTNRTPLKDILAREDEGVGLVGQSCIVAGWIQKRKVFASFAFVWIGDGSSGMPLQIIVDKETPGFDEVERTDANSGASFWAKGRLVASKGSKQKVEMQATKVILLGGSDPTTYPLAPVEHSVEHLREVSHLRCRTQLIGAVARVRSALAMATHKFFQERGFLYVHTPIITAADCEGAGEMFQVTTLLSSKQIPSIKHLAKDPESGKEKEVSEVDYSKDFFDRPAYLTVSGQLNAEQYACGLSKVYTFGPTFRAENSFTARHLAEFWMIEPEMAFCDIHDNMDMAEAFLKFVIQYALDTCPHDMAFFDKLSKGKPPLLTRLKQVIEKPFKRITYTEAIEILIKSGREFRIEPEWGIDMGSEHERFLTEQVFKMPIIVTDYPKTFKAFYMRLNDDGKTVAAMDVLVPQIGEIIGGSQREERLDVLLQMMAEKDLREESYKHYLDLRRYGSVVHSGFGLGFERLVLFTTGLENIREAIPFPRWPKHAEF